MVVSKGTRAGEYGEGSSVIFNEVQIYFSKYIEESEAVDTTRPNL